MADASQDEEGSALVRTNLVPRAFDDNSQLPLSGYRLLISRLREGIGSLSFLGPPVSSR